MEKATGCGRNDVASAAGGRYQIPVGVLCNVEGKLVPPEQALVPVLDRGFLYGDSVYEVVRTYAGRPFEMDRHLARMEKTAERIGLTLPRREVVLAELQRTLEAAVLLDRWAQLVEPGRDLSFLFFQEIGHSLTVTESHTSRCNFALRAAAVSLREFALNV